MATMKTRKSRAVGVGFLALGLLLLAWGCEVDPGVPPANQPPETELFVQGSDLDTLNYRQILHWWGTDRDGEVVGYVYRWSEPWEPEPGDSLWSEDSSWVFTTATTDTFVVPVGGSYAERTFEVAAVDDQGAVDPTPARQTFKLHNYPPTVSWSRDLELPELTLPATSFAWTPEDPDGRETIAYAVMWLDGDSAATARVIWGDTVAAVYPEQFQGRYGERTVYLQVFDEAESGSNILEHTWTVEAPTGDILLLDNVSDEVPGGATYDDPFYAAVMEAVAPGRVQTLEMEVWGGFRTAAEVLPLFRLYEAVVWYSGPAEDDNDRLMRRNLEMAEEGIRSYLEEGGRVYLCATNIFGDAGALSETFFHEVAGLDTLYTMLDPDGEPITDIALPSRTLVLVTPTLLDPGADPETAPPDTLQMRTFSRNVEFFSAPAPEERLFWLAPATLDTTDIPQQRYAEFHCGVRRTYGAGRLALLTFPLSRAGRRNNHEEIGRALLEWLLAP
jgi:hypothetical protein